MAHAGMQSQGAENGEGVAALRHTQPLPLPSSGTCHVHLQLARYGSRLRRHLSRMAARSKAHADLLFSFPAASVAIVTGPPTVRRRHALQLVQDGARLTQIADVLQLPQWARRLPPEAFDGPLPRGLRAGPDDADFARSLLGRLPRAGAGMSTWLRWVLESRVACDDRFALWIALQHVFDGARLPSRLVLPLALFAWFSGQPQLEAARLIRQRWHDKMGLASASWEAKTWLLRVLQDLCAERENTWTSEIEVDGLAFVPLASSAALCEEAAIMGNCLARYGEHIVFGACRIYSIRCAGLRLADLEVRLGDRSARPYIAQLLGPANNQRVSRHVRDAAQAWLALQAREPWPFKWGTLSDDTLQRFVWRPYVALRAPSRIAGAWSPPQVTRLLRDAATLYVMAETSRAP